MLVSPRFLTAGIDQSRKLCSSAQNDMKPDIKNKIMQPSEFLDFFLNLLQCSENIAKLIQPNPCFIFFFLKSLSKEKIWQNASFVTKPWGKKSYKIWSDTVCLIFQMSFLNTLLSFFYLLTALYPY